MFKKVFLLIILILLIWFLNSPQSLKTKNEIKPIVSPLVDKASVFIDNLDIPFIENNKPCGRPIIYTINSFDTKFKITPEEFEKALKQAEDLWENSINKDLFEYRKNDGDLKINLIYDYRQEATDKLTSINSSLKDDQTKYNAVKSEYNTIKSQYTIAINSYNIKLKSYNQKSLSYQKQVNYWNSHGGAPKKEYDVLQSQKLILDKQANQLQLDQKKVNTLADSVNTLANELNRLASELNLKVQNYNTIGEQRGETFKEGLYTKDETGQKIDIYEFSDYSKLVRVLAHELGHSLGIDHLPDPDSIMYEQNQSNSLELSKSDIDALNLVCQI